MGQLQAVRRHRADAGFRPGPGGRIVEIHRGQGSKLSTIEEIEGCLSTLAPETLEVTDESAAHAGHAGAASGGGHYQLTIVSSRFEGVSRIERHRLVYEALAPLMKNKIHALALRAYAPGEL